MKKKYISIFVCTLLIITPIISVTGTEEEPSFLGVNESLLDRTVKPPDPIIAAGPEHLVVMTNGAICIFDKEGNNIDQMDIRNIEGEDFWEDKGSSLGVWDPWVIYDPNSNRFIATAIDKQDKSILLAVTIDSDPSDLRTEYGWYKWKIDVSEIIPDVDFDKIGVDSQAVYISLSESYDGPHLICILEKEPLLDGDDIDPNFNHLLVEDTVGFWGVPIIYEEEGEPPTMYFINTSAGDNQHQIRINAIMDPLGEPYFADPVDLTVESYSEPSNGAPQQGTTQDFLNVYFSCIRSCVWRGGSLWAAHHYGYSTLTKEATAVRWYEIKTKGWPISGSNPEIHQSGDIPEPGEEDFWTFYPAIAPDGYGNAAICFGRTSEDEYPSIQYCYRLAIDDLDTMRDMTEIKNSNTYYSPGETPGVTGHRWGDYYGISCDFSNNRSFWMHGEYTEGWPYGEYWRTWVSRFTPTSNTEPGKPNIEGETGGTTGETYLYTFTSTDPDGDDVRYYINWNDGSFEWTDYYQSGFEIIVNYTYYKSGTATIKARANDTHGALGPVGTIQWSKADKEEDCLECQSDDRPICKYLLNLQMKLEIRLWNIVMWVTNMTLKYPNLEQIFVSYMFSMVLFLGSINMVILEIGDSLGCWDWDFTDSYLN